MNRIINNVSLSAILAFCLTLVATLTDVEKPLPMQPPQLLDASSNGGRCPPNPKLQAEVAKINFGCKVNGGGYLDGIDNGDYIGFLQVNFDQVLGASLRFKCCNNASDSGLAKVYINELDNSDYEIAEFSLSNTGGSFIVNSEPLNNQLISSGTPLNGKHDVYVKFEKSVAGSNPFDYYVAIVDWIGFYSQC